jgi:hypothetical protein
VRACVRVGRALCVGGACVYVCVFVCVCVCVSVRSLYVSERIHKHIVGLELHANKQNNHMREHRPKVIREKEMSETRGRERARERCVRASVF